MSSKEEYIFWRLAQFFIAKIGYRIVQLSENQKELWLEKLENKKTPVIRILAHSLDWSNRMQRDIEFTAENGEKIRKQLGRGELNVLNIYISSYPPVDDYQDRLKEPFVSPDNKKTAVLTMIMAQGEYERGFEKLTTLFGFDPSFSINEAYSEQEISEIKKNSLDFAVKKERKEREVFANGKPLFTYMFILIQVAMFFWLELHGGSTNTSTLIQYGAKFNPLIYKGEWWRFITPVFLHIGFLHLAMNTLALYYLGMEVERIYGSLRFLFIYLFAGVTGFIASFLFSSSLSAGASGAIFGCFGALLYFGAIYPKLFYRTMGINLFVVLAINLAFGFTASGIDNAGHIGGLVGGFLAAGVGFFPKKKKPLLQILFFLLAAAAVWGSLSYGFRDTVRAKDIGSNLILAQDYIKNHQYNEAYQVLQETEKNAAKPTAQLYFLLSFSEIKKGMLPEARDHLERAIKLKPNFHEAYYNLALIYLEENNLIQAKKNAEKAVKLNPEQKEYSNLVNEINVHIQSSGGGV
ncbi:rhomboid family intramembrane serine protease [Bacillota bacterium Lsc_1132]